MSKFSTRHPSLHIENAIAMVIYCAQLCLQCGTLVTTPCFCFTSIGCKTTELLHIDDHHNNFDVNVLLLAFTTTYKQEQKYAKN